MIFYYMTKGTKFAYLTKLMKNLIFLAIFIGF